MTGKLEICWCDACGGFFVRCPRCGNNTCSGASGENGTCPICPSAYDLMFALSGVPAIEELINKLLAVEKPEEDKPLTELECHCQNCEACKAKAVPPVKAEVGPASWYCCGAEYGKHEPSCKHYVPPAGEDLA